MQCSSCRAVYSNGLSCCPRCKTPASKPSPESETKIVETKREDVQASVDAAILEKVEESSSIAASTSSTLIEFPGVSRHSRPQWRKDLSERVREIQERRSRDSAREAEEEAQRRAAPPAAAAEAGTSQLGLVPQPDTPQINPIVAAALKRLERARQPPPIPRQRASLRGGTAAAAARVAEEQYETDIKPVMAQASLPAPVIVPPQPATVETPPEAKISEAARERALSIVPTLPAAKVVTTPSSKQQQQSKQVVPGAIEVEGAAVESTGAEAITFEDFYDDRAPVVSRIAGSLIDLLVVAFASSPFAAIIELTNGNWADLRVAASMGGIVLIVMFLYLTASTALAGRTWGMALVSLRAVDADTGLPPTTKQAVGRALLYVVSLITLGLGILYALFDPEGRTAHDHLSGTAVVRD